MSIKEEKRAKVKGLIRLALDDGTPPEEANDAAMLALKIVRKYKLLDLTPIDGVLDHPTVRAAKAVADKLSDPEFTDGLKEILDFAKAGVRQAAARRRRR
jgi:hypothetical protein